LIGCKREQIEDVGASVHRLMRESDDWFGIGVRKNPLR
jgi:hypothetical protein